MHIRNDESATAPSTNSSGLAVLCAFIMNALSEYRTKQMYGVVPREEPMRLAQQRVGHLVKSASWSGRTEAPMTGERQVSAFDYMLKQLHPKTYRQDSGKWNVRKRWLLALTQCVSAISKDMGVLMDTLFESYDWLDGDDAELFEVHVAFIEHVVSANAYMAMQCMRMLTKSFRFRKLVGSRESRRLALDRSHQRAHHILHTLFDMVPTAPLNILPLMTDEFPDKRESCQQWVCFLKNILAVADSIPLLMDQIVGLVVDRLIHLDVEIQVEIDEMDDDALENTFRTGDDDDDEMDDDEEEDDDEQDDDDDEEQDDENDEPHDANGRDKEYREDGDGDGDKRKVTRGALQRDSKRQIVILDEDDSDADSQGRDRVFVNVQRLIRKLDRALVVCFDHVDRCKRRVEIETGHPSMLRGRLDEFFSLWLLVFDRIVMKTHRCRYVQFIMFHVCSLDAAFPDMFLGFLMQKWVGASTTASPDRQYAVAYVASFIARATYVHMSSVRMCLDLMLPWIHAYLDEQEWTAVAQPDVEKHHLFYAACQALFYIYCFRHDQLADSAGPEYTRQWGLDRAIHSRLNPLKVCSPSVVHEFARIAHARELVYCYLVIERNKRSTLSHPYQSTVLETFFPFDPCRLRESGRHLADHYQEWRDIAADTDSHEERRCGGTEPSSHIKCGTSTAHEFPADEARDDMSSTDTSLELDSLSLSLEQADLLLARFEMHSPSVLADGADPHGFPLS